jgi:hypothetical protein
MFCGCPGTTPADVCHNTTEHTSAYVSIRQHTSAYVSIRQHTPADVRHNNIDVSSYYLDMCVLILVYMCPHARTHVSVVQAQRGASGPTTYTVVGL